MKKTILLASFAIATLFAFSSCQKENLQDNGTTNGIRIITAEFENNATKTNLNSDGVTPEWKGGDVIRILNETTHQDVALEAGNISNNKITFTTSLIGDLYAVYPATATSMTSCTDGKITFAIPAVQDGTFGSANICVAKGDDKDHLVFSNATAVLEFSQDSPSSTGVIRVAVDAANNIAGTLTAEFDENNKATVTATGLTSKSIFTEAASSAKDKYYIAIAPGTTGAVGFKYYKALKEASDTKSSATLVRNNIYALSIPDSGYEDSYVEITADYDNDPNTAATTLKWAKVNIGAIKPADFGHYFAWGYTDGCVRNSANSGWVSVSDMTAKQFDKTTDFPNLDNTSFQDAATANWGSNWRMPTSDEFLALLKNMPSEWGENYNSTGVNGLIVWNKPGSSDAGYYKPSTYNGTDNKKCRKMNDDGTSTSGIEHTFSNYDTSTDDHIFFPAAGFGNNSLLNTSSNYFWSSTFVSSGKAHILFFQKKDTGDDIHAKYGGFQQIGMPIRPVSD